MKRIACFFLVASASALAQSTDSQTLQALLQEMRQLRQDIQGMTFAAQRVQIILYRLQLQDDATKRAAQRHDATLAKVKDAERNRVDATNALKTLEEKLASLRDQNQRPAVETEIREMKRRVEMWSHDESNLRATEIAANSDLRSEQVKLANLQQQLDQLERQLENHRPARNVP